MRSLTVATMGLCLVALAGCGAAPVPGQSAAPRADRSCNPGLSTATLQAIRIRNASEDSRNERVKVCD